MKKKEASLKKVAPAANAASKVKFKAPQKPRNVTFNQSNRYASE